MGARAAAPPQGCSCRCPQPNLPTPKSPKGKGKRHGSAGVGHPRSSGRPCTSLPPPDPPKSQPHISKSSARFFTFSPQGFSQQFLFIQRGRLNSSRYSISERLFSDEVCVLVCKCSRFRQAANVLPGITKSRRPKYMGFAAACLLSLFTSFCYN